MRRSLAILVAAAIVAAGVSAYFRLTDPELVRELRALPEVRSVTFRGSADASPAKMVEEKKAAGYSFPYLYDESQAVAKAYHAACTPDFFLFDKNHRLVYRGQMDASRPGNGKPIDGTDLRAALDAVLAGKPVPSDQTPSIGCNIKWKPGNEPK